MSEYMNKATIFDIQRASMVDGPGIRTTVFFKGCNLKCKWCHNPESQSFQPQLLFYKNKCTNCGECVRVCPYQLQKCEFCGQCELYCPNDARKMCGKQQTAEELLKEVIKDKAFYDTSGGGVTFSGGECMLQATVLLELLKLCKESDIHTAVDTAGCVAWDKFESILPYTDMFLYDVKCFSEGLHIQGTGVSNKLILENLRRLSAEFSGDIIIRIPVIPGFNDDPKEIQAMAEFLNCLRIKEVELLPYHKMGEHKYEAAGMAFTEYTVPEKEKMEGYKSLFCGNTI